MILKRIERGWAGHFVGSEDCKFRRNTLLEYGDIRIVVSTVGVWCSKASKRVTKLGRTDTGHYYETMVFHAYKEGIYWDADVSREIIEYDAPNRIFEITDNTDQEANNMHEKIVDELVNRLMNGKTFEGTRPENEST